MADDIYASVDKTTCGGIKDSGDQVLNKGKLEMQRNTNTGSVPSATDKRAITSVTKCKFLSQAGSCKWGAKCRFLHPGVNDQGNSRVLEERPKGVHKIICTYFIKGQCKNGDGCTFLHPGVHKRPTPTPGNGISADGGAKPAHEVARTYFGKGNGQTAELGDRPIPKVICTYFIKGTCKNGDACTFYHPGRDPPASTTVLNSPTPVTRYPVKRRHAEYPTKSMNPPQELYPVKRLRNLEPDLATEGVLEHRDKPIELSNRYRDEEASRGSLNHDTGMSSRYYDEREENRRPCLESPRRDDRRSSHTESVLEKRRVGGAMLETEKPRTVNQMTEISSMEKPRTEKRRTENLRGERSKVDCKFYTKTGLCNYGDECQYNHPQGEKNTVLVLKNFFHHPDLSRGLFDNETRYDTKNLRDAYSSFYRYVHEKFASVGKIVMFKCCCNAKDYLQGSVFVQYATHSEAAEALQTFNGEMYGARRMNIKLVPLNNWKVAACGKSLRKMPHDEGTCSYLHFFPNPNGAYEIESGMSKGRSNSVVVIDDEDDHDDDDDDDDSRKHKSRRRRRSHERSYSQERDRVELRRLTRENSYGSDEGSEERNSGNNEYIVHVTRLPKKQTESDIRKFFGAFDGIKDVSIPESHSINQKLFSAFIIFENRRMAEKVLKNRHSMNGQELRLSGVDPLGGANS